MPSPAHGTRLVHRSRRARRWRGRSQCEALLHQEPSGVDGDVHGEQVATLEPRIPLSHEHRPNEGQVSQRFVRNVGWTVANASRLAGRWTRSILAAHGSGNRRPNSSWLNRVLRRPIAWASGGTAGSTASRNGLTGRFRRPARHSPARPPAAMPRRMSVRRPLRRGTPGTRV